MTVRWGMLSTASIGRVIAAALRDSDQAEFVAVAGRDAARAAAYADEVGIERSYGSYHDLLTDDGVDAVYIALPIALHTEWTIRALQAGKHVLCEKPFATSAADAAACFDAAQAAGRHCIEGLMWRHHPQTLLAQRLLTEGAIGTLALIRAALTVDVPPGDIRRTGALGGGAVLDLGCYCVSAIRLFGGHLRGSAPSRSSTPRRGPMAGTCAWPRPSPSPTTSWPSSTWRSTSPAGTNSNSSAPAASSPCPIRGCAGPATWCWNATR